MLAATTAITIASTENSFAQQGSGFGKVLNDVNKVLGQTQSQPHSTNKRVITSPDADFKKPHVLNSLAQDTLYTDLRPWRNNPEYRIFAEQCQERKETDYRLHINNANIAFNNLKARAGWVLAGVTFATADVFNSPDPAKTMRDQIIQINKKIKASALVFANANQIYQDWQNIVIRLDNNLTQADNRFDSDLGRKDNEFMRRPFWQAYMTPTRDTATQEKLEQNSYQNAQQQENINQAGKNGKQDVNKNAGRPKTKGP